jgi:polar amino acid transport system substrate-binding protein
MHRAISLICLLLFVFLAACSAHDSALDRVLSSGVLRVGTEPEFKPFESKNEKGELVGFDMDLARELAKDLGVELEFVELPFPSLIPALRTGKIDLAISGMTATEERALSVSFTKPTSKPAFACW